MVYILHADDHVVKSALSTRISQGKMRLGVIALNGSFFNYASIDHLYHNTIL